MESEVRIVIFVLFRYEDAWAALHKGAKDCAKAGEVRKNSNAVH